MTHRSIEDLLRDADRDQTYTPTGNAEQLWQRVAAGLDQRLAPDLEQTVPAVLHQNGLKIVGSPNVAPNLRVVHRANRQRFYLLMSIAAALLALLGAGWWLASPQGELDGLDLVQVQGGAFDRPLQTDRSALEGELELEGDPSPTLRRDLYEGIVIKTGDLSISALRVCSPC